ncbi:hypothetical protein JCM3770_001632 [Rhodotorula araucariae]
MPLREPRLSRRAIKQQDDSAKSPLVNAILRAFSNPWSDDNPDGVINAGLAENSLLHDWLTEFWERQGTLKIEHSDLTYGKSILGSDRIFHALGSLYAAHFKPHNEVKPTHIATSNGLSPMIEHLAAVMSDVGDEWLIPAPWYNGFAQDLNAASQVGIASVPVPVGKTGTLAEIEALEAEMERRKGDGSSAKVTAVLVTNPHNPLGVCYSREVLVEYCRFAERWNLFLLSDEIYALSVFDPDDYREARPFTSILSIDALAEAGCNPSRVVQLYGASKDFGANGFRAGVAVVQSNERVMGALAATAMPMRIGSPTDILWSALLMSPELDNYLVANRAALSRAYAYLTAWLRAQDLPYTPANAGHFVLVDFRTHVAKAEVQGEDEADRYAREIAFLNKVVECGVYIGPGAFAHPSDDMDEVSLRFPDSAFPPGFSYAVDEPGFFRMTFSIRRLELEIALGRLEKLCGLPPTAVELSAQFPA